MRFNSGNAAGVSVRSNTGVLEIQLSGRFSEADYVDMRQFFAVEIQASRAWLLRLDQPGLIQLKRPLPMMSRCHFLAPAATISQAENYEMMAVLAMRKAWTGTRMVAFQAHQEVQAYLWAERNAQGLFW